MISVSGLAMLLMAFNRDAQSQRDLERRLSYEKLAVSEPDVKSQSQSVEVLRLRETIEIEEDRVPIRQVSNARTSL